MNVAGKGVARGSQWWPGYRDPQGDNVNKETTWCERGQINAQPAVQAGASWALLSQSVEYNSSHDGKGIKPQSLPVVFTLELKANTQGQ